MKIFYSLFILANAPDGVLDKDNGGAGATLIDPSREERTIVFGNSPYRVHLTPETITISVVTDEPCRILFDVDKSLTMRVKSLQDREDKTRFLGLLKAYELDSCLKPNFAPRTAGDWTERNVGSARIEVNQHVHLFSCYYTEAPHGRVGQYSFLPSSSSVESNPYKWQAALSMSWLTRKKKRTIPITVISPAGKISPETAFKFCKDLVYRRQKFLEVLKTFELPVAEAYTIQEAMSDGGGRGSTRTCGSCSNGTNRICTWDSDSKLT
jgi:hypothetical protein